MSNGAAAPSRRHILSGLAAGSACLLAGTGARAITPRDWSDYGAVLDAACGPTLDHKRQIAAVETALGIPLPDARTADVLRRTLCPSCGCPLLPLPGAPGSF